MSAETVRIFIGSGEQSLLERKVLIHSLRKHTKRPLDIYVLNGTHNAVEKNTETPVPAPLSLELKYRNITEFSLYRYIVPELCGFQGRAIYVDSDTICLADVGELFDTDLEGFDFLAKAEAHARDGQTMWRSSVMLIDCARTRFDLAKTFEEIDGGLYTYADFSQFGTRFLAQRSYAIGELDPNWNCFDTRDTKTKLIHFTNLSTQPWKFYNHPYGDLWLEYFREAQEAGVVTPTDIRLTILRGYARPDLHRGNTLGLLKKLKSLF